MAQVKFRKKSNVRKVIFNPMATRNNTADLSAAASGRVQSLHIFLRNSDGAVKIRTNYNSGLNDRDYEPTGLTNADVTKLYGELNCHFQSLKINGDSENLRKLIAQESWYLYDKLVPDDDKLRIAELHSQYLVEEAALGKDAVLRPFSILVKAHGVTIPWELLYIENPWDDDKNEPIYDERYFLGYWALIQQDITSDKDTSLKLREFGEHGIKIFFDHNLEVARDVESPGIKAMFEKSGFKSDIAQKLVSDDQTDAFIRELMRAPGCIVHMACHSSNLSDEKSQQYICINENYILKEAEIRLNQTRITGKPLLFLNSCEMALVRPDSYCQFLNYFFERGFSAIIATEIEITDEAAWEFAKLVYTEFLQEQSATFDVAIFNARRAILNKNKSLIGFTYSYYGLGNLLRPKIAKEAA